MSTVSVNSSTPQNPDVAKAVGSYWVNILAAGAPATVNPADDYNSVSIENYIGTVAVRATITFKAGITGNVALATQTQIILPGRTDNLDFSSEANGVAGSIAAIESIVLTPVTPPAVATAAVVEGSTLVPLTANAACQMVLNFANR